VNISLNGHDVRERFTKGSRSRRRIVVTTLGTSGDLHPFLAIGLKLQAQGHDVIVATARAYRQKIERLGLGFAPVRPDWWLTDPDVVERVRSWRFERIIQELLLPALPQTYEDTFSAAEGADMLVTMQANFASRLVAEKKGIPWVSAIHFPVGFFSAYDPPVMPLFPALTKNLRFLGPAFWKPAKFLVKAATTRWARAWYSFRNEIGLPPDPTFTATAEGRSPLLHLALFSRRLAEKQRDWPAQTIVTGFPWYDQDGDAKLPDDLSRFLDDGPPPIVFSLGTAISKIATEQTFFEESAAAAKLLGYRAVLMVNQDENHPRSLPKGVIAFNYAPFQQLLPRAAAIVHHGGIGSTALAMRSGHPTLVVPCAWDQPDNAARATRLGIARTLPRHRYTAARAATELYRLLNDRRYTERAAAIGRQVGQEDGAEVACEALSKVLQATPPAKPDYPQRSHVLETLCPDEEEREVAGR
jgi:MGT family glycosyltransferase